MSDGKEPKIESDQTAGATEGAEEGGKVKGKRGMIIAAAVVLIALIGGGLFLSGVLGGSDKKEEAAAAEKSKKNIIAKPVYYDLPEFLVNLSTGTGKVSFLKMKATLELRDQQAVALVDANKPRILDAFNTYLRELRPNDLAGSAGIYRLREELVSRINGTVEEGLVKDILFSEIIIQ
jgi:flagellar FliL protein